MWWFNEKLLVNGAFSNDGIESNVCTLISLDSEKRQSFQNKSLKEQSLLFEKTDLKPQVLNLLFLKIVSNFEFYFHLEPDQ